MKALTAFAALAASMLVLCAAASPRAGAAPTTHTVTYDHYSLSIDGQRTYIWSAEFHYWRLPSPDLWRDVLEKLKAGGFNAVSIYFDWGYHSPAPGVYDFTGVRDADRVLDIANEVGLYVIARPGPYINAETDSGGFPGWVDTLAGRSRSSAADFQAASDEWLHQIDPIIARHQLTNGTGSVILYQIENEYGSNTDVNYMVHTEAVVRADGIAVPFTHNHCCGTATWATGPGSVDIAGEDSYPQGFNCSSPTTWSNPPTLPRRRDDSPIFTPEFQGGSFDPWGGPGYNNCRQLTGPDFEKVFYKNNIGTGATMQSFYMTFGGTSWGWLADPAQVYTSYDYGSAITEPRQLTTKYDEDKRIGYFLQAAAPLRKTEAFAATPSNSAISEQGRINPDDGTQFLVLRHATGNSTSNDTTTISIDLGAHAGYTYDDPDPALQYTGTWSHVGPEQSYTGGDYQRTESFSNVTGDSVSVTFTGKTVRWISSKDTNHGIGDVYLDGVKVATVDGYGSPKQNQVVFYSASGLSDGPHTLQIVVTGTQNASSSGTYVIVDAIDVAPGGAVAYPTVPQQPGTAIRLNGRDAKVIVANYALESQRLVYSTSELMTHASGAGQDVALLYGRTGEDGETVLRYASQPVVTTLSGTAPTVTWDAVNGDLRLNYVHGGLAEVRVSGGGTAQPLLLLLADDATAATFWRQDTGSGVVLERGPELVRTASVSGGTLALTGDTSSPAPLEVWAPGGVASVTWNGSPVAVTATSSGSLLADSPLAGPPAPALPALTGWKYAGEAPEAQPTFDDSSWTAANHLTTNNPTKPASGQPVLYADDYGFHHGDVWYRETFSGPAIAAALNATTGNQGIYEVWINGVFVSSHATGSGTFALPPTAINPTGTNVLAILYRNMGHNEDFNANETNKEPRGLISASLTPSQTLTWKIQGNQGGEAIADTVRGPMNNGGLYGERAGWYLAGYPDANWSPVSLPFSDANAGVAWYRTRFNLALPAGVDSSLGLTITDTATKAYRAQIFLNGWNLGQYVNNVGPQHTFVLPNGILRTNGENTLAIAVITNMAGGGATGGGLGTVTLTDLGTVASSLQVSDVASPPYAPPTLSVPGISPPAATPFSGQVGSGTIPADALGTALVATIDWGDGSATSAGSIVRSGAGYTVSGAHTYAANGNYPLRVTITDRYDGSTLVSATGTAHVGGPTAVVVSRFAVVRRDGKVSVEWRTRSEIGIAGFNVFRDGRRLNRALIPAKHPGQPSGASYRLLDTSNRLLLARHRYRLQLVGLAP